MCGKTPEVAALQDLLTYSLKSLSCWAAEATRNGVKLPASVASFLHAATFSTLTNVNFDPARFKEYLTTAHSLRDEVEGAMRDAGVEATPAAPEGLPWFDIIAHPAQWRLSDSYMASASEQQLRTLGQMVSLEHRRHLIDPTLLGLHEM